MVDYLEFWFLKNTFFGNALAVSVSRAGNVPDAIFSPVELARFHEQFHEIRIPANLKLASVFCLATYFFQVA